MLSYISFILAFALVASGSDVLEGGWRYEGQFVVGNPKLRWNEAGWKLHIPNVNIVKLPGNYSVRVHFVNPNISTLNDRLPESVVWTQMQSMNWLKTSIEALKRPFDIRFENDTVSECICDRDDTKDSIDMKLAFAEHLKTALLSKAGEHKTRGILGSCLTKVKVEKPIKGCSKPTHTKVSSITYYHSCEKTRFPIVGVIPVKPRCVDCQSAKRRLPLDSYNKVEVEKDGEKIMSILRQNVLTLPLFKISSAVFSIYGNMSLIRVGAPGPIPMPISERKQIDLKNIKSHNAIDFEPKVVESKDIKEAVKLIRAIVSEEGKPRKEENILDLYDMLSANRVLIKSVEEHLTCNAERNVFYSMIATQESHYALEVLMNATKTGKIPVTCVPVFMILSSKVSDMTDFKAIHEFIQTIKHECPLCATVSYLALSILVRRNANEPKIDPHKMIPSGEVRLELAMAGNLGINKKMDILPQNVIMKMAYVQSKRNPSIAAPGEIVEEFIKIFLDNKEATIVRAEAFKVVMGLSCNRSVMSTVFAELNSITDPVLISYVISYMKSYASNKVPFYKFMTEQIKTQLPLLKATKPELVDSLLAKHVTLSAYSAEYNMGLALLSEYIIPKTAEHKYMTASVEIQPYVMNTLISAIKVQLIAPVPELKALVKAVSEISKDVKLDDSRSLKKLVTLLPHCMDIIEKSEMKIFNDDMEILYLSSESSLGSFVRPILSILKTSGTIKGIAVPVTIKKYVHSLIGPHVEMSIVNYFTIDSVYDIVPNRSISMIPRMSAGIRLRLQADDKITINSATELKTKIEARNITIAVNKTKSSVHVKTFIPLQIPPMVTLEVIPTTGSKLGCPKRVFDKQSTPSLEVKTVPIAIISSLDDPAFALNISGKIEKPIEGGMLFALQEPQYLQLSLLPTYDLPSDTLVLEYVHSEGKCHPLDYCLLKEDKSIKPVRRCCRFCINSVLSDDTIATEGSALEVYQKDVNETLEIVVDSRIHLANGSRLGVFKADAALSYPSVIRPVDLLNQTYIEELKKHTFISLRPMQLTLNETEMTRQLHEIFSGIFLPESRKEDYTDMNNIIMALYPHLYVNDSLKIENLHNIFKTLLNISSRSLVAKDQTYMPNWEELKAVKAPLLKILEHPLTETEAEIVVMQDQVILWCLMQYFEIGYNYLDACNNCNEAKVFIADVKTNVFPTYFTFYEKSKEVVRTALKNSSNNTLEVFIADIYNTDNILMTIIKATSENEFNHQYQQLFVALTGISTKMNAFTFNQMKNSLHVMEKIVGFEMLKSIADHWHFVGRPDIKVSVKKNTIKTDLGVSFISVAARFLIQSCRLLGDKTFNDGVQVNKLISQAITSLDYTRWLRTSVIDDTELPHLKEAATNLVLKTNVSMEVLKALSPSETLDPMAMIFITEVIALHKVTLLELKKLPKYAISAGLEFNEDKFEWELIWILKNVIASSRPMSTLKRGVLKSQPGDYVSSSRMVPCMPRRVSLNASIEWPEVKLNVTITAKKSDSQVVNELQQSTLTRTENMAKSLTRELFNRSTYLDPLLFELNVYRDVMGMLSVEGKIPEDIKIELAKLSERVKVTLIPFESSIPEENRESLKVECPGNKCIRALISRDSKKVDILMKDPTEDIMFLQVPTCML